MEKYGILQKNLQAKSLSSYTVSIRIPRKLKKLLGCDLRLGWIHHKFQKLNFLGKIRSYVA